MWPATRLAPRLQAGRRAARVPGERWTGEPIKGDPMRFEIVCRWTAVILVAAGLLAAAADAAAQTGRERDRLLRELEKTDEIIVRAGDAARDAVSPRPRAMVARARQIEDEAWAAFREGQYRRCGERTRAARDEAFRAIRLSEGEFRAVERIRNLLESTQGLVEEAASVIPGSGNEQAERLFDAGRWQLGQAREAFRDRRFRQGLMLALTSRDLLLRALRLVEDGPAANGERLREVIARTEALAEEAAASAGDDPRARDLIEQGRRLLDEARRAARDGRPEFAFRRALASRERFLDALRLAERELDTPEVAAEVDATRRLLEAEGPRISQSGVAKAEGLLEEARLRQREAEAHLARGRLRPALTETKLAEALLRKALDFISP